MYASAKGHREVAQLLLEHDPDVNAQEKVRCWALIPCSMQNNYYPEIDHCSQSSACKVFSWLIDANVYLLLPFVAMKQEVGTQL